MNDLSLRVETERFGPFVFKVGVANSEVETALLRAEDAWRRFDKSPLASVANQLQREVLVQSVFGTNTIEGAELTEEETGHALDLDPAKVRVEQEVRVRNIKNAYDRAVAASDDKDWRLTTDYVFAIHGDICADLPHPDNVPGRLRDTPKGRRTQVGNAEHGGVYAPPQSGRDVSFLLEKLVEWHVTLVANGVSPLIRAPLVHLYFELIHPFWDGNGRVGRVLEATLLRHAGYRYAPFALAKFYQENIHQYFTLFNQCRKSSEKGEPSPNTPFIAFHLDGLRKTIDRLHDRVNFLINHLVFEAYLRQLVDEKKINNRQYAFVRHVISNGKPLNLADLRRDARYQAMYENRTDKTKQRDLRKLQEIEVVRLDSEGNLWPSFVKPTSKING
jgi:Fic family protein